MVDVANCPRKRVVPLNSSLSCLSVDENENPVQRELRRKELRKFCVELDMSTKLLIILVRMNLARLCCLALQPGSFDAVKTGHPPTGNLGQDVIR